MKQGGEGQMPALLYAWGVFSAERTTKHGHATCASNW